MTFNVLRALELLRIGTGLPGANFRDGQEDAIRYVVQGRGRLLVVQKTGWGKSLVYFIANKLLREAGAGPALLVSPLLSLMRNQILAAERMGVRARTIHSDNTDVWAQIEASVRRDEVDMLLISPERLANEHFRSQVLAGVAGKIALLVIDEAHCISDWGHDFRPHYRLLERIVRQLPPNMRLLATTATANDRVMKDLTAVLGPKLEISRGDLNRPSLTLQTVRLPGQAERLAWLAEQLEALPGHGIVYTLTVRDAERVAGWLKSCGLEVEAYTSESLARPELEQSLQDNRVKALVATVALGMGFDKPDLSFVIHYQSPGSVIAYYQQVGRAGRALDAAYGVLLAGNEDAEIHDYFIRTAFPTRDEARSVLAALEAAHTGLSILELMNRVNIGKNRIDKALELMSLESPAPVIKQDAKWLLTGAKLSDEFWERVEGITWVRRCEQRQMREYVALTSGHMEFLIRALDGDPSTVHEPLLPPLTTEVSPALVQEAVDYLRRNSLDWEPRKLWPAGGMPKYQLKGRIAATEQAQPGRVLCEWGDAGWGELVRKGKYDDGRFADELVSACAKLLREWNPQPAPRWVTCVPSLRHPGLAPDLARRLAASLGLPFRGVLQKIGERPEQKTMANSNQQAHNVDGTLAVTAESLPGSPVLLVDDMVDSRWTMTVAAWLLRTHGAGEVWPLALASTGHRR